MPAPSDEGATFSVPLYTLSPLTALHLFYALIHRAPKTPDPIAQLVFNATLEVLYNNVLDASNLTAEQAEANPRRLKWPDETTPSHEMIDVYLRDTPFVEFLQTPMPFALTSRFAHQHVVATPGAGKTNLLGVMMMKDFEEVAHGNASVIVLDSQGDFIHSIVRHIDFAPGGRLHERLVYIDPTDIECPLELNIFARSGGNQTQTLLDKRTEHSDILELLLFLFGALQQEATGRQRTLLRGVTSLIQEIPDATLSTLNEIFAPFDRKKQSLADFQTHIAKLDPMVQEFFRTDFDSSEFSQSRAQIRARIQSLITDPVFMNMFKAPQQKLSMAAEMDAGKVIVINANEDLLKDSTEACLSP